MIKISRLDTAIRIQKKSGTKSGGYSNETWTDIIDEDILCEWQNKFGNEAIKSFSENAKESARIRLWYIPGVTSDCRIVRVEDQAIFEIAAPPDDVMNRHQQLEIEIQRFVKG